VKKGDEKMNDQMIFQNILNETERIRWEVKRVEKNVLMAKTFAEEIFQNGKKIKSRYWKKSHYSFNNKNVYGNHSYDGNSCVFTTSIIDISSEDKHFMRLTEYMDLIFKPLVENNPYILFAYIISKRGVTRGYPWKDFSILPTNFDPSKQNFFFIADEKHNPKRKVKWTEPYLCPLTKTWMLTCSSPVWNNSNFIGMIGIDINLGKMIEPMGQSLKLMQKGYSFIISPHGNLIISSDEGMNSLREDGIWIEGKWKDLKWRYDIPKKSLRNKSIPIGTQITEIELTSGKRYLLYSFIKETGWSLITILPKGAGRVLKKMMFSKKSSAASVLNQSQTNGDYLPLMSFASAFSKSLQHIEKLIEGTKVIGKGILDHQIKVSRKDEIGLLALSINKMAKDLKKGKEEFESAYKRLSQLDRLMALGRMAAGVAHEINNPLGIISNYVQILLKNSSLDPLVREDLLLIEEEIHKMGEITKGLLNFSRESEMKKTLIDLNEVLRKSSSLLKFQFRSQSIQFIENYNDRLPLVLGDSNHLQQAFLNIMLNSIQSMPEGGELKLRTDGYGGDSTKKSNGRVLIEFSDTGSGIETKYLDKIFDPFFTTKGVGSGTGLGLSISYGIIKEHRGNIDVKSRLGKGTLVKIVLPVLVDPQAI
jgi:signal transduction histidine kinase